MSISPHNLWPEDIAVTEAVAPVSILKDQASKLAERTKNLVEARVRNSARDSYDDDFAYDFELVAPALNNYRYRLFAISHDVQFYPLFIHDCEAFDEKDVPVDDEEQFLKVLKVIFSSERTK